MNKLTAPANAYLIPTYLQAQLAWVGMKAYAKQGNTRMAERLACHYVAIMNQLGL